MRGATRIKRFLARHCVRNDDSTGSPGHARFGKGGQSKFLPALASSCPTELQASTQLDGGSPDVQR